MHTPDTHAQTMATEQLPGPSAHERSASIEEQLPKETVVKTLVAQQCGSDTGPVFKALVKAHMDLPYSDLLRDYLLAAADPDLIVQLLAPPPHLEAALRRLVEPGTTGSTIVITRAELDSGLLGTLARDSLLRLLKRLERTLPTRRDGRKPLDPFQRATTFIVKSSYIPVAVALRQLSPTLHPTENVLKGPELVVSLLTMTVSGPLCLDGDGTPFENMLAMTTHHVAGEEAQGTRGAWLCGETMQKVRVPQPFMFCLVKHLLALLEGICPARTVAQKLPVRVAFNLALRHTDEACAANARAILKRDPVTGQQLQRGEEEAAGEEEEEEDGGSRHARAGGHRQKAAAAASSKDPAPETVEGMRARMQSNAAALEKRKKLAQREAATPSVTEPVLLAGLDEEDDKGGGEGEEGGGLALELVLPNGESVAAKEARLRKQAIQERIPDAHMVQELVARLEVGEEEDDGEDGEEAAAAVAEAVAAALRHFYVALPWRIRTGIWLLRCAKPEEVAFCWQGPTHLRRRYAQLVRSEEPIGVVRVPKSVFVALPEYVREVYEDCLVDLAQQVDTEPAGRSSGGGGGGGGGAGTGGIFDDSSAFFPRLTHQLTTYMRQQPTGLIVNYVDFKRFAVFGVTTFLAEPFLIRTAAGEPMLGLSIASKLRYRNGEWDPSWSVLDLVAAAARGARAVVKRSCLSVVDVAIVNGSGPANPIRDGLDFRVSATCHVRRISVQCSERGTKAYVRDLETGRIIIDLVGAAAGLWNVYGRLASMTPACRVQFEERIQVSKDTTTQADSTGYGVVAFLETCIHGLLTEKCAMGTLQVRGRVRSVEASTTSSRCTASTV